MAITKMEPISVAELAENEGHHPDLHLVGYRNAAIELWTHAIGGLSENDFITAAKINQLPVDIVPHRAPAQSALACAMIAASGEWEQAGGRIVRVPIEGLLRWGPGRVPSKLETP